MLLHRTGQHHFLCSYFPSHEIARFVRTCLFRAVDAVGFQWGPVWSQRDTPKVPAISILPAMAWVMCQPLARREAPLRALPLPHFIQCKKSQLVTRWAFCFMSKSHEMSQLLWLLNFPSYPKTKRAESCSTDNTPLTPHLKSYMACLLQPLNYPRHWKAKSPEEI
jgi:hypothetical protein